MPSKCKREARCYFVWTKVFWRTSKSDTPPVFHASFGQRQNEAALLIPVRFGFALLFLTLLLSGRAGAIRSGLRMIGAHRGMMRSLHHPVLCVGSTCVPGRFAVVRVALGPLDMLLVPVEIFGPDLVAVFSSISCSCS